MDTKTLATEVAPIIIQLPPKAVWTATAAVVVALIAIFVNIWLHHRTLKHQRESDEKKRQQEFLLKNQDVLLSKYEQFSVEMRKVRDFYHNLGDVILKPRANQTLPSRHNLDELKALSTIYFSSEMKRLIMSLDRIDFTIFRHIENALENLHLYSVGDDSVLNKYIDKQNPEVPVYEILKFASEFYSRTHPNASEEDIQKCAPTWGSLFDTVTDKLDQISDLFVKELEKLPIKKQYKLSYRVTHPDKQ